MGRQAEDEKKLKQGGLIILEGMGLGGMGWGGVITMNRIMQKQSSHNGLENYIHP